MGRLLDVLCGNVWDVRSEPGYSRKVVQHSTRRGGQRLKRSPQFTLIVGKSITTQGPDLLREGNVVAQETSEMP
jgi:hypothetical protein